MRKLTTPAGYVIGKGVLYENLSSPGQRGPGRRRAQQLSHTVTGRASPFVSNP
jgi:hypothetical protein